MLTSMRMAILCNLSWCLGWGVDTRCYGYPDTIRTDFEVFGIHCTCPTTFTASQCSNREIMYITSHHTTGFFLSRLILYYEDLRWKMYKLCPIQNCRISVSTPTLFVSSQNWHLKKRGGGFLPESNQIL